MTTDDFKQTLINQYSAVIEGLIVESETVYRSHIDYAELDFKIRTLIKAAKVDGLEETVIWEILQHRLPSYMDYLSGGKIAA